MKKITFLFTIGILDVTGALAQKNTFYSSYNAGGQIYWYLSKPVGKGYLGVGTTNNNITVWAMTDSAGNFKTCNTFSFSTSTVTALSDNSVIASSVKGKNFDTISLLKISPSGKMVWAGYYTIPSLTHCGIGGICELNHSGNILLSGSGNKTGNLNLGFILQIDSSGNLLKSRSIMGDTVADNTITSMGAIAVAGDNTCYLMASMQPWQPTEYPMSWSDMIKIDSSLNVKWARSVNSYASSMIIRGNEITMVDDPYLFDISYTSYFYYTYVSNFDTSANCKKTLVLNEIYKGSSGIAATKDGGEIIYGQRGNGSTLGIVTKLDTGLNIEWSKYYIKTSGYVLGNIYSAYQTTDGGYILSCNIENSLYQLAQGYIVKTDSLGHQGCTDTNSKSYPTIQSPQKYRLDTMKFSPVAVNTGTITVASRSVQDTVLNYCYNGLVSTTDLEKPATNVNVYPNPNSGKFTISVTGNNSSTSSVEVYNCLGEKVQSNTFNIQNSTFNINLFGQPAGIYLYRIINKGGSLLGTGKVIIE